VHALIRALDDDNSQVRWGAASALGEIGGCPDEAVQALSIMLGGKSSGDRVWAARGIGLFGRRASAAVSRLITALDDPSASVRSGAAWALGRIGPDARPAIAKLLETRDDEGPANYEPYARTVGEMACAAIWAIDPPRAKEEHVPLVVYPWNRFGQDRKP
jgi:HEAT repeat protein